MRTWIVVAALAGGCGGGGGGPSAQSFVGTYTVTAHHANMQQGTTVACSDPGPAVTGGPTSFALVIDATLGDPFVTMQTCSAPGSCTDTLDTFTPGGAGLEELSANTQTGGGATCNLYAGHGTVTLTDGVAHIEVRSWFDAIDVAASDCTLARAEALRQTPDCESVEVWDGTRMP
jgi:hypothetical protein